MWGTEEPRNGCDGSRDMDEMTQCGSSSRAAAAQRADDRGGDAPATPAAAADGAAELPKYQAINHER